MTPKLRGAERRGAIGEHVGRRDVCGAGQMGVGQRSVAQSVETDNWGG